MGSYRRGYRFFMTVVPARAILALPLLCSSSENSNSFLVRLGSLTSLHRAILVRIIVLRFERSEPSVLLLSD